MNDNETLYRRRTMEQIELQRLVEKISLEYFNKPFSHQAIFNNRLRTTGGRYHLDTHHLDFNLKVLEAYGTETFEGIIKHELCHYHLHLEGKGYRHGDQDFKKLLKKVSALRYTPSLEIKQGKARRWEYQCKGCQTLIYRKRRFNVKRYVCAECHGAFHLKDRVELNL